MDRIYKVWKNMSDISAIAALKFFYNDLKRKINNNLLLLFI